MDAAPAAPWHPDRRWADPLIALMATLALLAATLTLLARQGQARRPEPRASLQGRFLETVLCGPRAAGLPVQRAVPDFARAASQLRQPWDRALLAVLAAEAGERELGRSLAEAPTGPEGEAFRAAWRAAYQDGPLPDPARRAEVGRSLGGGYAATLLEARLRDREGGDGEALRRAARADLARRVRWLGAGGFLAALLLLGGLGFGIHLWVSRRRNPPPLPAWGLSGRAAALVFLAWFLAFFLAGNLAVVVLAPWPALRWAAVPLGYATQVAVGLSLICRAEGCTLRDLWARVAPGPAGPALLQGLGFLALAVTLVMGVNQLLAPLLPTDRTAQRDLVDLVRGLQGLGPNVLLFLVVAVLAPLWEEFLFRGFLLPVLARRAGAGWAILVSALLFGAIHLQPLGLPTLCTLGLALGLGLRRTGNLWTPILVHACWNGSVFLVMRLL